MTTLKAHSNAGAKNPAAQRASGRPHIGTLESAVLEALKNSQRTAKRGLPSAARKTIQTGASRTKATTIRKVVQGADPMKLVPPGQQSHLFLEDLKEQGLLTVQTVRIRPKGEPDRRFVVEFAVDPQEPTAVILRVRPASTAELSAQSPEMLTTQQAADRLNVSRPYVARLVDDGTFQGVERTQSGHRRIPRQEVDRVQGEMRASREAAFLEMDTITTKQRTRELNSARAKSKRSWVKTS